ncbi:hypothetical protein DL93DRAFT_2163213 [Clavulina sp. PMI_390]|nr:hypothetical protein DL93DRAFT_2163213 [Clavulina sp. PMI_390]
MSTSPLDPLRCIPGVHEERRVLTRKRRMSAPVEKTLQLNPFSDAARKKLRLSEPDDLSKTPASGHSPRNACTSGNHSSPISDGASCSPSNAEYTPHQTRTTRRSSRASLATLNARKAAATPTTTTRQKPALSVQIPPPFSSIPQIDSPLNLRPSRIVRVPSIDLPDILGESLSTPSSTASFDMGNYLLPPQLRTPVTPFEQLINRPANPPEIPHHPHYELNEAQKKRSERLFAPTPTEWAFGSTIPFPRRSGSFGDVIPYASSPGVYDQMELDREGSTATEFASSLAVPFPARPPRLSELTAPYLLTPGEPIQPLASPYVTHFPSPATSVATLPISQSPTSVIFSSSSSFSSTNSSAASSRTSSPVMTTTPLPSVNLNRLRRPLPSHRRSSLGPNRALAVSATVGAPSEAEGHLMITRPEAGTNGALQLGYFDVHPRHSLPLPTTRARSSSWAPAATPGEVVMNEFGEAAAMEEHEVEQLVNLASEPETIAPSEAHSEGTLAFDGSSDD